MARCLDQITAAEQPLTWQAVSTVAPFASKMIFGGQYSIH